VVKAEPLQAARLVAEGLWFNVRLFYSRT